MNIAFLQTRRYLLMITALILLGVFILSTASAAPADPFSGSSPSFNPAPEEATNYNVGDWGVADERGAATYTYPIVVPPGRNGMAPELVLRYSSNSPLRGDIAAGWTLNIPTIEKDFSLGVEDSTYYRASLNSTAGRLVSVPDELPYEDAIAAYRVNFDESFTRIFRRRQVLGGPVIPIYSYYWTALTSDGVQHHFNKQLMYEIDPRWHIVKQEDPFGNTVNYTWSVVQTPDGSAIDQQLDRIRYSANEAAGLVHHAKVEFEYAPLDLCTGSNVPIGASMRTASTAVNGAQRLTAIKSFVRETQGAPWRLVRQVDLTYELHASRLYLAPQVLPPPGTNEGAAIDCKQNLLRYLTEISVTGFDRNGNATTQPPLTFEYNRRLNTTPEFIPPGADPLAEVTINSPGYAQDGISGRNLNGARTTLLDVDSDGVRDRVTVERIGDVCHLVWYRGLLGGTFENNAHSSPLPTAAWYDEWKGEANSFASAKEACTLSGQIVYRDNMGQTGPDGVIGKGIVSYHFMDYTGDGVLDLILNVWATYCHETYHPKYRVVPPSDIPDEFCMFASNDPVSAAGYAPDVPLTEDEPPIGGGGFVAMTAENQYGNPLQSIVTERHRLRLYVGKSDPDNLFAPAVSAIPINLPAVLPVAADDERLDTNFVLTYPMPPLFDLDGDGFLDVINTQDTTLTSCSNEILLRECDWTVYFGDGSGNYPATGDAFVWTVPKEILATPSNTDPTNCAGVGQYLRRSSTIATLSDFTGDGKPDLIAQTSDNALKVYANTGRSFSTTPLILGSGSPAERRQTDCFTGVGAQLLEGGQGFLRRLIDLDGDGLLDMIWFADGISVGDIASESHRVWARFGLGDRFGESVELPEVWLDTKRLFLADWAPNGEDVFAGEWHVDSDFTDVTGDGLPDLVNWMDDQLTYISSPGLPQAADRLKAVENGRGLRVEFTYSASSDANAVGCLSEDCTSYRLPYVTWVVTATEVDMGFGHPSVHTEYHYHEPAYLSAAAYTGLDERAQFAGFRWTDRLAIGSDDQPLNQVRKEYNHRARGVNGGLVDAPVSDLIRTWHYRLDNGQSNLQSFERQTYHFHRLFNGQAQVKLPKITRSCTTTGDGMDQAECMAQPENVLILERTWTGFAPSTWSGTLESCDPALGSCPSESKPELYLLSEKVESIGAEGRRTTFVYNVRYGQQIDGTWPAVTDYRVNVSKTERSVRLNDGEYQTVGRSTAAFGLKHGLPNWKYVYQDEETVARTRFFYDQSTGNTTRIRNPMQHTGDGGSGNMTDFEYDDHQLFVRVTTNELGHQVTTWHDMATGELYEREGPNTKIVAGVTKYERERWVFDGLGRLLRHRITFDDDAAGYVLRTLERFTYDDWRYLNSGEPVMVHSEVRRDIGANVWVTGEQDLDGAGRVLTSRQLWQQDGLEQVAASHYTYDERGNLLTVEVPSPADDGQMIAFSYEYDVLNRPVAFYRPDGTGVIATFQGLNRTTCDQTNDATGGCTTQVLDPLGRLIELHELYNGQPVAVTTYGYDGNDNLRQIIDADGNVTTITHDWAGNRAEITRGARTWRYVYDLSSNLTAKISPYPAGASAAQYTVTYSYDDLNRVVTVQYANWQFDGFPEATELESLGDYHLYLPLVTRGSTAAAAAAPTESPNGMPTTSTFTYTYDEGVNGIGQLTSVQWPFGNVSYQYEARGLLEKETRTFSLDGPAQLDMTKHVTRQYNMLGLLTQSTWEDGQRWRINYDRRGLVGQVRWYDPVAAAWQDVADYERGLTGLPLSRSSSYGQVRTFGYDVLGRPLSDVITVNGATIADRAYSYTGAGNLATAGGHTGGVSATAAYTYDAQDQLLTASGPNGYQGSFSYSPAGNLLSANVNWSGTTVRRNVNYEYGGVDPQAVDRLVPGSSGRPFARFEYDLVGNMSRRVTDTDNLLMTWNGLDQIRAVQTINGSEIYYYDHEGSRVLALSEADGVRLWFGETESHFDLGGAPLKSYLHLAAGGPTLARVENGTNIELQYADAMQNLMVSLDSSGEITASFLYGPFGEVVFDSGEADHRRQFNGKENDQLSELRYYGHRFYDPLTLRWNSADPLYLVLPEIGLNEPRRMNLYSFSLNSPTNYFDADGRDAARNLHMPNQSDLIHADSMLSLGDAYRDAPGGSLLKAVSREAYNQALDTIVETYGMDTTNSRSLSYSDNQRTDLREGHTSNRVSTIYALARFHFEMDKGSNQPNIKSHSLAKLASVVLHELVHADQQADGGNAPKGTLGEAEDEMEAYQIVYDNREILGLSEEEIEALERRLDHWKEKVEERGGETAD